MKLRLKMDISWFEQMINQDSPNRQGKQQKKIVDYPTDLCYILFVDYPTNYTVNGGT